MTASNFSKNTVVANRQSTAYVSANLLDRIRDTAILAAKNAGRILLEHYEKRPLVNAVEKHDVKLEVDLLCEKRIMRIISESFPHHNIISEEGGANKSGSKFVWIIDPLDGSLNYSQNLPFFCVCVACYLYSHPNYRVNFHFESTFAPLGKPLVGVVYAPIKDELFIGITGREAKLNGRSIRSGPEKKLEEAVIAISYGSHEDTMKHMEKVSSILIRRARKVRIFGSTGMDIAHIACGRIAGLYQRSVQNWDFAAARIILEQSSGKFEAREIYPNRWEIIACAPGIYRPFKKLLSGIK